LEQLVSVPPLAAHYLLVRAAGCGVSGRTDVASVGVNWWTVLTSRSYPSPEVNKVWPLLDLLALHTVLLRNMRAWVQKVSASGLSKRFWIYIRCLLVLTILLFFLFYLTMMKKITHNISGLID